ncbi:MAG: polyisoprenoid-binding protein [Alphaproteobacteria bacterium]|nr:polyisoprenoid-binding protein [Alphaproteobacteria bacterium]
MRHFLATSTVLMSLSTAAFAAGEWTPPSTALDKVPSGIYTLDKSHASVTFTVKHLGFSNYTARFDGVDAKLDFNAKDVTKSKLEVTIDTGSASVNNPKMEEKWDGPAFFNIAQFPTATFKATKIEKTSDTEGTITGDFTMLGVTKPVTLRTTFNGAGFNPYAAANVLGFSAIGKLNRSDFGLKEYLPAVGDEVKFYVEVEFNQPAEKK